MRAPLPLAAALKLLPVPSQMVWLEGLVVTVTDELTVSVAELEVAAGGQTPVTTQRNL